MNYKEVIESRYNRQSWQLLLHDIFGSKIKFWNHPSTVQTSSPFAKQAFWLGTITLSDEQTIAVYEVELADSVDIERNRRGIRDMLLTAWRNNGNAGAFMFCYRKNESVLRFSYVSESWKFADDGSYQKESTDTRRFTYLLGEGHRSRTAIQQFEQLRDSGLSLKDLTKAFSVDAVSDMFFDGYKKQYENIIFYITGKRMVKVANKWEERLEGKPCQHIMQQFSRFPNPEKAIRDYVKKLMGRLVFLQFLQKKGWLGVGIHDEWGSGDSEFIQNLFKDCPDKDHFVNKVLNLLFNDLNTERKDDLSKLSTLNSQLIKIPYLNGGLFEREAADEMEFPLPAKYMQSLLDFFASYNFTIDENDPDDAEVGVDPEMLGRIFENLLEDNKDKGAFYTPKEIVSYMCRESLIAYLQTGFEDETTKEAIRQFVTTHQIQEHLPVNTDQLLKDVKICDPAIGSGAFPMGLLKELFLCRTALEGISQHQAAEIKKHIIQQNVYGVDIERGAVDIARLRFWLSLIVDEETPQALPNLDFKIMQGNSLIESYGGFDLSRIAGKTVGRPSTSTQYVIGLDSDLSQKNLQRLLREYFSVTDHQKKATMRHAINAEVKTLIRESVGGTPTFLAKLDHLDPSANQDFFLWHTWFKDIFDKGGFDIVIGNPPYISIQGMSVTERNIYKGLFKFFFHRYDIFGCFIERGISLLAINGILMLIQPSVFLNSKSFMKCREYIVQNTRILNLDLLKDGVFKSAVVPTMIMGLSNRKARNDNSIRCSKNGIGDFYPIKQSSFLTTEANVFNLDLDENTALFIKKTQENCVLLGDIARISRAFNVGDYERFLSDTYQDGFIKVLKGASISKWIYEYKGFFLKPDFGEFVSCGDIEVLNSPKLMMKRIGVYPNVCYDDSGIAGLDTIYTIRILSKDYSPLYVMGLLNSKLIGIIFRKRVPLKGNVFPEFRIFDLNKQIPIKKATASQQNPIISIVKQIVNIKQNDPLADVSSFEREIDQKVYELYGLTGEEIRVIEG